MIFFQQNESHNDQTPLIDIEEKSKFRFTKSHLICIVLSLIHLVWLAFGTSLTIPMFFRLIIWFRKHVRLYVRSIVNASILRTYFYQVRGRIFSQFGNEVYGKSIESSFLAGNELAHSSFPAWLKIRPQAGYEQRTSFMVIVLYTSCLAGSELISSLTKNTASI